MRVEDRLREYLKRVTADLQATRERLQAVESGWGEPVAIVGMSCRYPGAESPEELWRVVDAGRDMIADAPADRGWDPELSCAGGFVADAGGFDADLFGISPREALGMDPQQRLVLEAAWEAFERAGIDPHSLRGGRAGVFVGGTSQDFAMRMVGAGDSVPSYITGGSGSVLSGRVAYVFGLEGPAVTIDTACSSSLVAVHLAVQSLRSGESSLALAGGVAVMSTPGAFLEFSRQGGMAFDGRCKSFAAAADGTGWGEGVGMLLLERLSDARRNGRRVLGIVRGTAVNQDGASNGLTAPNGLAQQRVIRAALSAARLLPGDVDVVEAHGTGTVLGDPIEAQALLAAYGQDRDRPLLLGSIKSNIGHAQAASGVAGVIKMVLALRHGVVPRTLHVDEPSPHVDWSAGDVELVTGPRPLPEVDRPWRAGVSSFGISGTNAHVIVEQPPEPDEDAAARQAPAGEPAAGDAVLPFAVSGKSEAALRAQAGRLRRFVLESPEVPLRDLASGLVSSRAALDRRATVLAAGRDELLAGLVAVAGGTAAGNVVSGTARGTARLGVVFSGQGSERVGMGRELYEAFPVFRDAFDEVCAVADGLIGCSLRDAVFGDAAETPLRGTLFAQLGLFVVEVSLFRLVRSWGVPVEVVLGHSLGEVVAAHVAGVFGLADAVRLVVARGRLMDGVSGGAMAAVEASEEAVRAALADGAEIAAVNGPDATVVSGERDAVRAVAGRLAESGARVRWLRVEHGFHSAQMEPVLEDFRRAIADVRFHRPEIPVISNVTGGLAGAELCDPGYWVRHVRRTVRFADGVGAAVEAGATAFLELGPDGSLTSLVRSRLGAGGHDDVPAVAGQRRGRADAATLLGAVAALHAGGLPVDWRRCVGGGAGPLDLPTYPFQRRHYWLKTEPVVPAGQPEGRFWDLLREADAPTLAAEFGVDAEAAGRVLPGLLEWRRREDDRRAADSWRYRETWRRLDLPEGGPSGRWLVLVPDGVDGAGFRDVLAAAGAEPVVLPVEGAAGRRELAARLAESAGERPAGVLSLLGLDERPGPEGLPAGLAASVLLVQALGDAGIDAPLWCVTSGAVTAGAAVTSPVQNQLWGLGRVVALEHPRRWGGLVDLPSGFQDGPARLMAVLASAGGEDQVAIRESGVFGRRLTPHPATGQTPWRPGGTMLITGGTGALGARVARWAAERGVAGLLLTSRQGADAPGAAALTEELTALGTHVTVAACDVADRDELAALLREIPADRPLASVVHAAGVAAFQPVADLGLAELAELTRAKVTGAANLDALTADLPLEAFVLFSSGAAAWGSGGNAAYAAGNAYLDALAADRTARGLPATAIAWGTWAGGGMADGAADAMLSRRGVRAMAPEPAIAALAEAVAAGEPTVTVADMDWSRFAPTFTLARPAPLLDGIPAAREALRDQAGPADAGHAAELRRMLAAADDPERAVADLVRAEVAVVLGHSGGDDIDPGRPFADLGFDSLTAVELRDRLTAATGLSLPATLVFDRPTVAELAAHLLAELRGDRADPSAAGRGAASPDEPIAIVAMGCRYPGGVESPADLWELVASGADAIAPVPGDRGWTGENAAAAGGFLRGAGGFDAGLFAISPREALAMDPQQRLLLETSWETFERAGIDPLSLKGSATGVFVGGTAQDHSLKLLLAGPDGSASTSASSSVLSGRLAYSFGLVGPAVTVDTACSSSLVGLHLAAQSLRSGECDLALAGGVTVMATPGAFMEFARQGGLAGDGRCKSFAAAADGTGWGEGVGLVLLERLSDAERNGRRILGVVRGSAVNQDGASNGLTAPNGLSQQRVIGAALASAGLSAGEVDVVEAHGTGTVLGDPIEAQAVLATYGQDRERPVLLGSVKSNIGHTQAAAGVAGVIKMVMALREGVVPASLHLDEPSPHVDWSSGAVELAAGAHDLPELDRPWRAGISSFGISGTNAHVIIEQAPEAAEVVEPETDTSPLPFPVSGKTDTALREQAARLRDLVLRDPGTGLRDVAWTLMSARAALERRAVVIAADRDELAAGLAQVADEGTGVWGAGPDGLRAAATAWTAGSPVEWPVESGRTVELPTYAFQRADYWLDGDPLARTGSGLDGWRYRETWEPVPLGPPADPGPVLAVLPAHGLDDAARALLTGLGRTAEVHRLTVGDLDRESLAARLRAAPPVRAVLSLLGLDERPDPDRPAVPLGVAASLLLAQGLLDAGVTAPQWWLTRGAVSTEPDDPVTGSAQAQLLGIGRVMALEHPRTWGGLVDVGDASAADLLARILAGAAGEDDQVALRADGVLGRRLVPAPQTGTREWRPRGTVLITGGTGGLGAHVARWAAANGAEQVVLVSRSGKRAPGAAELEAELAASTAVRIEACDVADRDALAALLDGLPEPPTAVVHAAGATGSEPVAGLGVDGFAAVTTAKVAGAANLDALTAGYPLDAFVLFSSCAGLWGSAGGAAYCASNTYLTGLAQDRARRGLPATSIAWGAWAGEGMSGGEALAALRARGLRPMPPEESLRALALAVGAGDGHVAVTDVDWSRFAPTFTIARPSPLIGGVPAARAALDAGAGGPAGAAADPRARDRLAALPPGERQETVARLVRTEIAAVLGYAGPDEVGPARPLAELGFDSLTGMELRDRLARATGLTLPATVVFDHPTADALARELLERLGAGAPPAQSPASLAALYRDACAVGRFTEANEMIMMAGRLRATFADPAEPGAAGSPVRMATGAAAGPVLVGIPATSMLSGPHEFVRFARALDGKRELWVLPVPGFVAGEKLPATLDALVELHANAALDVAAGRPLVLVGRSSGGTLAHQVALRLEERGVRPAGLVLLDTYEVGSEAAEQAQPGLLANLGDQEARFGAIDDVRLTAMAAYFALLSGWRRRNPQAPSLFVRATGDLAPGEAARSTWSLDHELAEVAADHFSMTEEHAEDTAATVDGWITTKTATEETHA
nr:hypothetical protein GCM10010200_001240 [Actinomadura rugatobispora]